MSNRWERPHIQIEDLLNVESGLSPLITHDLCSALSDVLAGLELVDLEILDPKNLVQIERAQVAGQLLGGLIESLIKGLQGTGGVLGTEGREFNFTQYLNRLEKRWAPRAAEKGILFELDIQTAVPDIVQLDQTALDRVLSNGLENAIKFTDTGKVRMTVGLGDDSDLTFVVRDTGPGFSDAALKTLFDFGGRPAGSTVPGSGLGLHIAARLVEQMKGEISAFNAGMGGVLTVNFASEIWSPQSLVEDATETVDLKGLNILLAEDNKTNQVLLGRLLESLNAQSELATNGIEALEIIENKTFDLALIDVEMPLKNGLEVIQTLRKRADDKAQLPIIAISAFTTTDALEKIKASGADGTISKPILEPKQLGSQILKVLQKTRDRTAAASDIAKMQVPNSLLNSSVYERLVMAVGAEAFPELIRRVLNDLQSVQSELVSALERPDYVNIRAQTHILVSVAGAVGAKSVQAHAQILNAFANERAEAEVRENGQECLASLNSLVDEIALRRKLLEGGA